MARIDQVRDKLAASMDGEGKPRKGYNLRAAACRRELDRLELEEAARTSTSTESVGVDTPADPA